MPCDNFSSLIKAHSNFYTSNIISTDIYSLSCWWLCSGYSFVSS